MLRTVLRAALTVTFLLVVYFAAPLDGRFSVTVAFALPAGLVALGGSIAWQARAIARSAYPRLRAVEALATLVPLFLVLFASTYCLLDGRTVGAFSEHLTRTDALYFTVTVFSSVGFGDITPRAESARVLVMVQMLGNLVVFGLVVRILLHAVTRGLDRRTDGTDAARDG